MGELASKSQLRMSFTRIALVCVPLVIFLGFLAGSLAGSGEENRWFAMLQKPALQPPGWLFGVAWSILYAIQGFALALIIDARGARGRTVAICLFAFQLTLNLAWSPTFFMMHQVSAALILIVMIFVAAALTTFAFARVRKTAALLMLPYLAWLAFASVLNYQFDQLNPAAERIVPEPAKTEIIL
jgi:tryptophan-rich sensory protein